MHVFTSNITHCFFHSAIYFKRQRQILMNHNCVSLNILKEKSPHLQLIILAISQQSRVPCWPPSLSLLSVVCLTVLGQEISANLLVQILFLRSECFSTKTQEKLPVSILSCKLSQFTLRNMWYTCDDSWKHVVIIFSSLLTTTWGHQPYSFYSWFDPVRFSTQRCGKLSNNNTTLFRRL